MADLKYRTGASATVNTSKEDSLEKKLAGIMGTTTGNIKKLESQLRREREAEEAQKKAEEEARKRAEAAAAANAAARAESDNKARLADLLTASNRAGVAQSSKNAKMVAFGEGETGAYTAKPTATVREKAVKPNLPTLPTVNAPVATPPPKGDVEAVTLEDQYGVNVDEDAMRTRLEEMERELNTASRLGDQAKVKELGSGVNALRKVLGERAEAAEIEKRNALKTEKNNGAQNEQESELERFQKYDAMDAGQMEGQIRELENRMQVVENAIAANDRNAIEAYQRGEMVEYNRYENERARLTQMRDALEDELRALNDAYAQKAQFDREYSARDRMMMRNVGTAQTRMDVAADAAQKNAAYIQAQGVKLGQLESKIKSFTGDPSSPEYAALVNEYNVAADLYNQAVALSSRRDAQLVDSIGAYYDALDARNALDPVYQQSYENAIGLTAQIDGLQRQLDELYLQQKAAAEAGNTGAAEVLNQQIGAIDEQIMALMKERAPLADYAYTYDMTRTLDELPENDLYLFRSVASEEYSAFTAGVGNPEQARAQLLEKYSEKEFDRILGYVQRQYNAEKAAQRQEKYEQLSSTFGGAVLATVASVVTNVIGAPGAVYEIVKQGLENSGTMTPYDTNTAGFWAQNATRGLRGAVSEQINNPVGEFVYQTLTSAIDSAAAMALAGASGGVLLGVSAAANSMQDIAERGGDLGQIISGGVMAGVFEGLFEQYSIGNFYALKDVPTTTYRDMARNILTSAGVNAQEEAATELANIMYDFIALGDASNYAIRLRELMTQEGLTEAQAKKALAMESATQIALAAASGALMGVGFGATGSVDSYIRVQRGEVIQPDDTEVFRSYMMTRTIAAAYLPADRRPNMSYVSGRTTQDDVEYYAQIVLDRMKEENRKAQQEREADREAAQRRAEQEQERAEIKVRTLQTAAEVAETVADAEASANTDVAQTQQKPVADAPVQQVEASVSPQIDANAQGANVVGVEENISVEETERRRTASEVLARLANNYTGDALANEVQSEIDLLEAEGESTQAQALQNAYNEYINGGNTNAEAERAGILSGEQERNADARTGRQADRVGTGAEIRTDTATAGTVQSASRQNIRQVLEAEVTPTTSAALGVQNGTTGGVMLYEIPQQYHAQLGLDAVTQELKRGGVNNVRYVSGLISAKGRDGAIHYAEGVTLSDGTVIVSVDAKHEPMQIARHEMFHARFHGQNSVMQKMLEALYNKFTEDQIRDIVYEYVEAYAPLYGDGDMRILEEFLADAYAGLNRFGATEEDVKAMRSAARTGIASAQTQHNQVREVSDDEPLDHTAKAVAEENNALMIKVGDILFQAQNADGEPLFSATSMREDIQSGAFGQMLDTLVTNGVMSQSEIDDLARTVNRLVDRVEQNPNILDFGQDITKETRPFLPIKPNSDALYGVSAEFSTVCRKRVLQQAIQERLEREYDTVISKEQRIAIRDALMALRKQGMQLEVACALCYVESARLNAPNQIAKFLSNKGEAVRDFIAKKDRQYIRGVINDVKINTAVAEIEAGIADGRWEAGEYNPYGPKKNLPQSVQNAVNAAARKARAEYKPSADAQNLIDIANTLDNDLFRTQNGLWELKRDYPIIYDAFSTFVRAATHSKMVEGDTPFYVGDTYIGGDGKGITDALIERRNKENGIRSQSWSDFQVIHMLDYIGLVAELSSRGAKMHAYTKVTDYIRFMGKTGQMINGSLIPKNFTGSIDAEAWDAIEGIAYEELMSLRDRYPDTVGNCAIGIDDRQIRMMMNSVSFDYIIPYHRSGLSADARARMHIQDWGEYQDKQSERKYSAKELARLGIEKHGKRWQKKPIFSEWFDLDEARYLTDKYNRENPEAHAEDVTYGANRAMNDMAQRYIELCHERGLEEKFKDFAEDNGYWKLLVDRKMINHITGEIIEQMAVKPIFDESTLMDILKREVLRYQQANPDERAASDFVSRLWEEGKIQEMALDPKRVKEVMDTETAGLALATRLATDGDMFSTADEEDIARFTSETQTRAEYSQGVEQHIQDNEFPPETVAEAEAVARGELDFGEVSSPQSDSVAFDQLVSMLMSANSMSAETVFRNLGVLGEEPKSKAKKAKVSQFRTNTLQAVYGEDTAKYFDENAYTYLPVSEQESLRIAMSRMNNDLNGLIEHLTSNEAWDGADMDAAMAIMSVLRHEASVTGDLSKLTEWAQLVQTRSTENARVLQSLAKYARTPQSLLTKAADTVKQIGATNQETAEDQEALDAVDDVVKAKNREQQLQNDLDEAQSDVDKAKRRVDEAQKRLDNVETDEHQNEEETQILDNARMVEGDLRDVTTRRDRALRRIEQLRGQGNEQSDVYVQALQELDDAVEERDRLRKELSDLNATIRSAADSRDRARRRVETLRQQGQENSEQYAQALVEQQEAEAERDRLRRQLSELNAAIRAAVDSRDRALNRINQLRDALNTQTDVYVQALQEMESAVMERNRLVEELSQLNRAIRSAQNTTKRANERAVDLAERIAERKKDLAEAQDVLRAAQRRLEDIKTDYAAVRKEYASVTNRAQYVLKSIDRYEGKVTEALENIEQTQADLRERISKLDDVGQRVMQNTLDLVNALDAVRDDDKDALIRVIERAAIARNTVSGRKNNKHIAKSIARALRAEEFSFLYDVAMAQIENVAIDMMPTSKKASFLKKLGTYQTMAQLLNLRTALRNVVSNQVFDFVEFVATNPAAVADLLLGFATHQRTVNFDAWWFSKAKREGSAQGARRAAIETYLDVEADNAQSKYGTKTRRTWNMQKSNLLGRGMSRLEAALGYELNVTDEFLKGGVEAATLQGLMPFVEQGMLTREQAQEMAHQEALYRSFQDDTAPSRFLAGIKKALNAFGFKSGGVQFGLGDLVQKYTQVPGALISRAVEFSPLGYAKMFYSILQIRQDGTAGLMAQRNAALAFGRAMTGTGLIAFFMWLANLGIIKRRDDEENKDIAALSGSEGIYGTQVNISALLRLIRGKDATWEKGDILMDIDFLEPLNALMSLGTAVAAEKPETLVDFIKSATYNSKNATFNAILETPTMQTWQQIAGALRYKDEEGDWVMDVAIDIASSSITGFVPSLMRQFAQASDYAYRDQYSSQRPINQLLDRIKNTIPFVRQTLPEKLDNFGEVKDYEDKWINRLNALVMPGGVYVYERGEISEELARLREATGEDGMYPSRYAPYNLELNLGGGKREKHELTPEERTRFQTTRGTTASLLMAEYMASAAYENASDEQRAAILTTIKNIAEDTAKRELYESLGIQYRTEIHDKYYGLVAAGVSSANALDLQYRNSALQKYYSFLSDGATDSADAQLALLKEMGVEITGVQNLDKLALIRQYNVPNSAFVEMATEFISDARGEDFDIMLGAGLTQEDVALLFNEYTRLNKDESLSAFDKATEFAHYVDMMGIKNDARNVTLDTLTYSSGFRATADTYQKYVDAGLDSGTAKDIYDAINALEPLPGNDEVTGLQKMEAIVAHAGSPEDQIAAYVAATSADEREKTETKLREAYAVGITPKMFVDYRFAIDGLDAKDANGESVNNLKKARVTLAIDALDLTDEQKDYLWLLSYKEKGLNKTPWHTGRTYSSAEEYVKYL